MNNLLKLIKFNSVGRIILSTILISSLSCGIRYNTNGELESNIKQKIISESLEFSNYVAKRTVILDTIYFDDLIKNEKEIILKDLASDRKEIEYVNREFLGKYGYEEMISILNLKIEISEEALENLKEVKSGPAYIIAKHEYSFQNDVKEKWQKNELLVIVDKELNIVKMTKNKSEIENYISEDFNLKYLQ
ncbi:hypothetical protein FK178_09720 [Antarcticibacterium arcticum]|uniref:Lipoprotein n=1 Tax=Antarcticibacterium arcticum TaxID=2585771 RepID=A0A5B8YNY2_9FLAO|nr:hypothetical protein [Antarcticibacterium arcticum]QED37986.1 hypothetical protein FK178_09720 [Antarcticibacterium arcticum]